MKTWFIRTLALCILGASALVTQAATFEGFSYTENGTSITISRYPDDAVGAVFIPPVINGKPVTSIGEQAFSGCSGLTSVTIPNNVTSIGRGAFWNCRGLTSMAIPDSVTGVGGAAFSSCTGLTSVTIPNSITSIESYSFNDCTSLTSVAIPNGVTSIGTGAFARCAGLTSIIIPNSVTTIRELAFSDCTDLASVALSNGITRIGGWAFNGCRDLASVRIPNNVMSIEAKTFNGCTNLTSVTIPNNVTSIGTAAFAGCTNLTSVKIPSSVTNIFSGDNNEGAFFGCSRLSKVIFLGSAPNLGNLSFDGCAAGFKIYYYDGEAGFTWPSWNGLPVVAIGPNIGIRQPRGAFLVDGVAKKSFGTMLVNNKSWPKTFKITNIGSQTLSRLSVKVDGLQAKDFIVTQPAKVSLATGASTKFKVKFKPTAKGTRRAAIHIKSNDAKESPFDIKLIGLGVK